LRNQKGQWEEATHPCARASETLTNAQAAERIFARRKTECRIQLRKCIPFGPNDDHACNASRSRRAQPAAPSGQLASEGAGGEAAFGAAREPGARRKVLARVGSRLYQSINSRSVFPEEEGPSESNGYQRKRPEWYCDLFTASSSINLFVHILFRNYNSLVMMIDE